MDVRFEDGPGYLIARGAGTLSLQEALKLFERVLAMTKEQGAQRVLIDALAITSDVADLDCYDLGKHAAALFTHVERIAIKPTS